MASLLGVKNTQIALSLEKYKKFTVCVDKLCNMWYSVVKKFDYVK